MQDGDELRAIHHLTESHAVILRQHIIHRFQKTRLYEILNKHPQTYGLKPTHVKFKTDFADTNKLLRSKLSELPKGVYCTSFLRKMYIFLYESSMFSYSQSGTWSKSLPCTNLQVL